MAEQSYNRADAGRGQSARQRIAVFICKCGTNVSNFVDVESLANWAGNHPDVCLVDVHTLLCSPDGRQHFQDVISSNQIDRALVAACSPRLHEKTFQGLVTRLDRNVADVHIANIREHCAWVTTDKEEATAKARCLINAGLKRLLLAENLESRTMKVNTDVLVIGGGIAGIEAALLAAGAGRKVTIVERQTSLGGAVIRTDDLAPTMECSPCLLAPRLAAVRDNANITVLSNAEVTEVLGFYGNFTVHVHKRARHVKDECMGCEACFDACPVSVPSDFHLGLGTRKAIYTLFPGAVPAAAAIDKGACTHLAGGDCAACVSACPFGCIDFNQADEQIQVRVGAVVVATGFAPSKPSALGRLGYKRLDNVYTLPEFERLASSNGPTRGVVALKDGSPPKTAAVIHCAGSLTSDGLPYCSHVCCTAALKVGHLLRKQHPDTMVYNIHNDMVLPTSSAYAFRHEQEEEGTRFVRCTDLKSVTVEKQSEGLQLSGDGLAPLHVDLVVLATGMAPADGSESLLEILHIARRRDGFFAPDNATIHETGSSLAGIYIAGCAAGPCDAATSVTRAQAAVGDALSKLVEGREIQLESMTSFIIAEECTGCKLCLMVCPYKAVSLDAEKQICVVNEAICRGCGTCTATCPSGASRARHYTDEQIYAEIEGVLHV